MVLIRGSTACSPAAAITSRIAELKWRRAALNSAVVFSTPVIFASTVKAGRELPLRPLALIAPPLLARLLRWPGGSATSRPPLVLLQCLLRRSWEVLRPLHTALVDRERRRERGDVTPQP